MPATPAKPFFKRLNVKRSDLHFGQTVFLSSLDQTEKMFGADNDLKSMLEKEIVIYDFDISYNFIIRIMHPALGTLYPIHLDDISLTKPHVKLDKRRIIKVEQGKEVIFDETQLFI